MWKSNVKNIFPFPRWPAGVSNRSIQKSFANRRVEDWEASNGHTRDTTRLFHRPWHNPVGEHISMQPFRMWNRLCFHPFLQVSQIFQRRKSDANQQDFENKLNLTCHAQSTSKTIGILTKVFCTSGPNLVALAWTGDELSHGQAQNGVNFELKLNLTLKVKVNHPQNNRHLNQGLLHLWSKFGDPSLGVELSRGQTWWRTDGRTQATTIPGGQYWPRVKMASGMTKMQKSVIGSVCAYLMSCKAHYQYHEFGTLDA